MLLFDQILVASLSGQGVGKSFAPWFYDSDEPLLRAIAVKIDNVMEMIDADFPNNLKTIMYPPKCIPPFRYTFLDSYARNSNKEKRGRFGIHTTCISDKDELLSLWRETTEQPRLTRNMNYSSIEEMGAKYAIRFTFIEHQGGNGIITRSPSHTTFLDKDGNLVVDSGVWHKTLKDHDDEYDKRKASLRVKAHVALFVFSLMNCKNIIVQKEDAPLAEQRERIKKTGFPLVTYRVLKVDQVLTKQKATGEEPKNPGSRGLHLCRGHFAHYGSQNPLFGKYTGTFWRPQHARGRKEMGVVIKSYEM